MRGRPSHWLLLPLAGAALTLLSFADAARLARIREAARPEAQALVQRLGLTDLALFTEARYTRHPSQSDLHSAFQNHPVALEHFPSGSLVRAPAPPTPRDEPLDRTTTLPR